MYLDLSSRGPRHGLGYLAEINATCQVHLARMNAQNIQSSLVRMCCVCVGGCVFEYMQIFFNTSFPDRW